MNRKSHTHDLNPPFVLLVLITLCLFAPLMDSTAQSYPAGVMEAMNEIPETVDYNFHVKPILSDRCYVCHGPDENTRMMELRLDTPEGAYAQLWLSDGASVVPHEPESSFMVTRILSENAQEVMPPPDSNLSLTDRDKATLIRWIEQGGEYKKHWSFIPLQESENDSDSNQSIDSYIASHHAERGLDFSPEASKEILLRRVSFDLTGLPPSVDELHAFLNDDSADAYERAVDRLLDSPHYGERMAQDWLDLARYADTYGYQADNYRPMWRWRDWVINAYNDNMPYDQFVTEQLAGDLFDSPSRDQILATGFNRNHPQNAEGGIINEEFRVEYVADRTNTFGKALIGMTMECARCHDHKYDPISQVDYFSLFSFFNQVDESGQITWTRNDIPSPTLLLPDEDTEAQLDALREKISHAEAKLERLSISERSAFHTWLRARQESGAEPILASRNAVASFPLDDMTYDSIASEIHEVTGRVVDPVSMALEPTPLERVPRGDGTGLRMNGDAMLDFPGVGRFRKGDTFSVGMWVYIPEALKSGVIFHANKGGIIYSFQGYQLSVEDGLFDIRIAHTFPAHSIHLRSSEVPREEWAHVMLTYDGGGKASSVRFYLNGVEQSADVMRDNLAKDIVFIRDGIGTNLRVGARWRSRGFTDGMVDDIHVFSEALSPLAVDQSMGGTRLETLLQKETAGLSARETDELFAYYLHEASDRFANARRELRALRHQRDDLREGIEEVMVMADLAEPRKSFLHNRGLYNDYGVEVFPDTPDAIAPFDDDLPRNRLGLARWLTDEANPLTARVLSNRLWQQFFEKGLVETPEDFGSQGKLPSHPELLDWLAREVIRRDWDVKAMQKMIVMSRTYRQSSRVTPEALEFDPENTWVARGPRQRLSAEKLRDQALAASRLLTRTVGGPSVKPYQPEGLWSFGSNTNYTTSTGSDLYRRSVYTFWKRTVPPPSMNLFDAPSRSVCTVQRQKTSTPMQALVLMNDPQFVEASRALAVALLDMDSVSDEQRIAMAFQALTSREPKPEEASLLLQTRDALRSSFATSPERTDGLLSLGEFRAPESMNPAEVAAMTVVVNTIMNSDASVMKR